MRHLYLGLPVQGGCLEGGPRWHSKQHRQKAGSLGGESPIPCLGGKHTQAGSYTKNAYYDFLRVFFSEVVLFFKSFSCFYCCCEQSLILPYKNLYNRRMDSTRCTFESPSAFSFSLPYLALPSTASFPTHLSCLRKVRSNSML